MNAVHLTGYLPKDAVARATCTGAQKLTFEVVSHDSHGESTRQPCVLEDSDLIKRYEPLLDAGRAVVIAGELCSRAVKERDVVKFITREIRVLEMEIPNRTGVPAKVGDV